MDEVSAITNKSNELCFSKDDFTSVDFSVDTFVSQYRKHTSLETLKEDLGLFLKVLQSAMVELINKDYADFVNLSTNLVGLDKSIKNLSSPLFEVKDEITKTQSKIVENVNFLEEVLSKRDALHTKKTMLNCIMNVLHGIDSIENQNLQPLPEGSTEHLPAELIERIAVLFNQIEFHMSQNSDIQIIKDKQITKDKISANLLQHLASMFLKSLKDGDVEILHRVLRIYSTIDKISEVEKLFRHKIVKPFIKQVIDEEFTAKEDVERMYKRILDFIPEKCSAILKVTRAGKRDYQVLKSYDFLVNSVWPEIVLSLEYIGPMIFSPGNPKLFHKNYKASINFVDKFEHLCVVQTSVKRLREHPSYKAFMGKWNLMVYFEIRFQEIGGLLETALLSPITRSTDSKIFLLNVTVILWQAINLCWDSDVYIQSLGHKFWRLTLQLLSRYYYWVKKSGISPDDSTLEKNENIVTSVTQLVCLVHDVEVLSSQITTFFNQQIILHFPVQSHKFTKDSIKELCQMFNSLPTLLGELIIGKLTKDCSQHLRLITDIPRLYRKTNRDVPTKPSNYISLLFSSLDAFLSEAETIISEQQKRKWMYSVINNVTEQCLSMTGDVLTSVKKMEDSLKRLKKARDKPLGTSLLGTMSDDDKIRQQLVVDVEHLGQQMNMYGIDTGTNEHFKKLEDLVTSAVKMSGLNS